MKYSLRPIALACALAVTSSLAHAQGAARLAASTPARDVETLLTFGPATVGVTVEKRGRLTLRATEEDLEVRLGLSADALSRWLSKAEIMLLLVGEVDPVPPLKADNGTLGLRALSTWGTPRYELTVAARDRSRAVVAELNFEEATDLLRALRAVAPVVETPKPAAAVDRAVAPRSSNRPPIYPTDMRRNNVGGEVVLRLVIDTDGRVEEESIEVLRSSDPRFLRAVRNAVLTWRFVPAELQGKPVRQVVELPFIFDPAR